MAEMMIGNRAVGDAYPPVVIAEIGINHGGSIELAIHMADTAIGAGAEIVKHQTHVIDDEMSEEAKLVIPGNADISIYDIMEGCALSEEDELVLMRHVQSRGAIFISTPFSRAAAERLQRFNIPAIKIGSGECNNYPLIRYVAKMGKPVIISTGMNTIESVRPSVDILRAAGVPYALLHCTNVYPTPPELVAGMFVMFDSKIYREIAGFDTRYFMYLEDVDICQRLTLAGKKVRWVPRCNVVHDAQRASRNSWKHLRWHARSTMRFLFGV